MKNGVTTPDLTGRFIVGAGTSALLASQRITKPDGGNYEVNEDKGGLNEVALTTKEMPSHEHSGSGTTTDDPERNDGDHKHKGNNKTNLVDSGDDYHVIYPDEVDYSGDATIGQFGSQHKHDFDFTTNATGGKEDGETKAHENRPPYYALAFIMRVN
jgi:microcystin-dependent protein